jgi:hypothetical protein
MIAKSIRSKLLRKLAQGSIAVLCSGLLLQMDSPLAALAQEKPNAPTAKDATASVPSGQEAVAAKISPEQLDSLVAPIALYPDPMLAQVLAASTYPLEIVQLQQFLAKHKDLKDKALADAVSKQPWDPSVQGMAAMPEVVKRLSDDIQWTTDLGNAFLAQQSEVMDAVQRMRTKAKDAGNLKSNEQQKVETKVVETKQVVVIEQANPQVVYVPSYNPTVVYGPPVYPYPPIAYPPPGYYAAGVAISFGVGLAMGAAWGGGWGYGASWGGNNDITINNNNNYNRNSNINGGNRVNANGNRGGGASGSGWQHNPQHRGGTPYSNSSTANKYGGTTRGASASDRQANARQNQVNSGNRGQAGANPSDRSSGGANRSSSGGAGDRGGNRSASSSASSRSMNGSSARASSSRGGSSMGARGGGGRRR